MPITVNERDNIACIRATANETYTLADIQLTGEVLNGLEIKEIFFSGNCAILRGANTIFTLNGTDHWRLDQARLSNSEDVSADITINVTNGTCLIVLDKHTTANTSANNNYYINP